MGGVKVCPVPGCQLCEHPEPLPDACPRCGGHQMFLKWLPYCGKDCYHLAGACTWAACAYVVRP